MATYKATLIMNHCRQGWTESWYISKDTYAAAETALLALLPSRAALMSNANKIEAYRISDVEIRGDSVFGEPGALGYVNLPTDTPWNAILARVNATALYRRQVWLRGVPDEWIDLANGTCALRGNLPNSVQDAFNNFVFFLLSGGWKLKVGLKSGTGTSGVAITAINVADTGNVVITVPGGLMSPGESVLMGQWTGPDKDVLNHSYRILRRDGNDFEINLLGALLTNIAANLPGKAFTRITDYQLVTSGTIIRLASRQTGRAFFASAGRRRARR